MERNAVLTILGLLLLLGALRELRCPGRAAAAGAAAGRRRRAAGARLGPGPAFLRVTPQGFLRGRRRWAGAMSQPEGKEVGSFDAGFRPLTGLLLIDCQKAFLSGEWAHYFGAGQVEPIQLAFERTAALLRSAEKLAGCALLCTKCYTSGEEAEYQDELQPLLAQVPCVWKPTTDVTRNPRFHEWLRRCQGAGMRTLVIGGCTTTSCVRVSSQQVRRSCEDPDFRVVVDLSLCGARADNYLPNAEQDPDLVRIYGRERCRGTSPVELAVWQMREAGVEVVEEFDWHRHNKAACSAAGFGCESSCEGDASAIATK